MVDDVGKVSGGEDNTKIDGANVSKLTRKTRIKKNWFV